MNRKHIISGVIAIIVVIAGYFCFNFFSETEELTIVDSIVEEDSLLIDSTRISSSASTTAELSTCAEAIAGPERQVYRLKGIVTKIVNHSYGNWYLKDETGEVYVYGTLDAAGNTKKFLSLGIELGDVVTIEGPKINYDGIIEIVNVTVVDIEKSPVRVDSLNTKEPIGLEGGDVTAIITNKGGEYTIDIEKEARSWLSVKQKTNDKVVFHATANNGGGRSAVIKFKTNDASKKCTSQTIITQNGAIAKATIAEFLKAPVGEAQYRVSGIITKIVKPEYGNVILRDFSGETFVYGIGAKGEFEKKKLKVGDVVTLVGKRAEHAGKPQMNKAHLEESISVKEMTLDQFLTQKDSKDVYYKLTAIVDDIEREDFGNLFLRSGNTRIYVYGCYPGWGANGDARKNCIAINGIRIGDRLTVIGTKSTHNGSAQLSKGIYVDHEKVNATPTE